MVGSGIGGLHEIEAQHTRLLEKGPEKVSAFTIPKLMVNAASGQLSIQYGLQGPNAAVVTACASATNAIGDAFKPSSTAMPTSWSPAAARPPSRPWALGGFAAMRALSERNDDPHRRQPAVRPRPRRLRPQRRGRDAGARGTGARQGPRRPIYAEMLGYGVSADAGHITQPDKDGVGAAYAMMLRLARCRLDPTDIDYINAHGTSTPLGDQAETIAIKSVFKEHARKVSISSTKSQLGHLLGASGGVELMLSVLAIRDGVIPPTINYEHPDPLCDLDYTPNQAR